MEVGEESVVVVCAIGVVRVVGVGVDIGAQGAGGLDRTRGHAICLVLWEEGGVDGEGDDEDRGDEDASAESVDNSYEDDGKRVSLLDLVPC